MDCLAAPEYQKRPGCKRQLHDTLTLAFQNASDDFLLIIQTPNTRHILKEPALARLLQHERDRELRFVKMPAMLTAGQIEALTFTSSSTAANFLKRLENEGGHRRDLAGLCLAAIGPVTAETMAELGMPADVVPASYTVPGLIKALEEYFAS